ncbi:hypothetical protein BBJ29_009678 [Phytophthora kernoviae]|uniref:Uncharacterized protein n=1 Tax=Phytophthora kernoviae TaxID=325452 RepID=A0A3F2RBM7_9STRA|nr:hypothetical protein BBP00_00009807 [Phytophthora kernoviae]RLN68149.1 hypothetical protein BBJ29_009678 [Phytophthora kernoviae]
MPAKTVTGAALAEARKGKKKLTKRPAGTGDGGTAPRKSAREATKESETDVEERAAAPPAKKAKKILASTLTANLLRPAGTRAEQDFNLSTYLSSFDPDLGRDEGTHADEERYVPATPSTPTNLDVQAELQVLRDEAMRLHGLMANRGSTGGNVATHTDVTAPNAKGELPPPELRYLTNASTSEGSKKVKGDYNPPASREQDVPCVQLRYRYRGLTLMHFEESSDMAALEERSTNVNFANDFSASAVLPLTSISCSTYRDILDTLHGSNVLGQEVWYDHMRKLTSQFCVFVAKNKSANPVNTPA